MENTQAPTRNITDASEELIAKMKAQLGHIFDVDSHGNLTLKPTFGIPPFTMIYVKGGEFVMGDEKESDNPPHPVKLSSFFMAEYPVTQELYQTVTGKNPSRFQGINHPVEKVNWFEAMDFCNILNSKIGYSRICNLDYKPVDTNGEKPDDIAHINGFRLPTEAEWEYAGRGGVSFLPLASTSLSNPRSGHTGLINASGTERSRSADFQYAGSNYLDDVGWYDKNNEVETRAVGVKLPNVLGIYDMSGNVWEWCWDWYNEEFFVSKSQLSNPVNLKRSSVRVVRGGSWRYAAARCRMANRHHGDPKRGWRSDGFRLLFAFQFT